MLAVSNEGCQSPTVCVSGPGAHAADSAPGLVPVFSSEEQTMEQVHSLH